MTTANPPPEGHLLDRLMAVDDEEWVRTVLRKRPGFMMAIRRHAENCNHCAQALTNLFPGGVPEPAQIPGLEPDDLERIFEEIRQHDHRSDFPGSRTRGGGA